MYVESWLPWTALGCLASNLSTLEVQLLKLARALKITRFRLRFQDKS